MKTSSHSRLVFHSLPYTILWWVIAMLALIIAFRDPILDIIKLASGDLDRGYVVLAIPVAIYLAVLRRWRFRSARTGPSWLGPAIVLFAVLISRFGLERDHIVLWHIGPTMAFIGLVVSRFGAQVITSFFPAILALFAVTPVPGFLRHNLAEPLQRIATQVSSVILDTLGFSVVQMGNLLEINSRWVAVGEACNGMRLLLPLGLVMFAFVFSLPLRNGTRVFLLLASIPVALICNIVRLVPTAIAYGYFPKYAESIHDIAGWLMIPFAVWILVLLLRLAGWLDFPVGRWRLVGA